MTEDPWQRPPRARALPPATARSRPALPAGLPQGAGPPGLLTWRGVGTPQMQDTATPSTTPPTGRGHHARERHGTHSPVTLSTIQLGAHIRNSAAQQWPCRPSRGQARLVPLALLPRAPR